MPNGEDKNWIRLCATVDGFYARYGRWPTRVRLCAMELNDLRDHLFSPKRWGRITSRLKFVVEPGVGFIAEDERGTFDYRDAQETDFARIGPWIGEPDWPEHAPRFTEKAFFTIEGTPFDFDGGPDKWKEHCRNVAAKHLELLGIRHLECDVKVSARFFMRPSKKKRDLDNMLKNLLDSLGAAGLFGPSTGGGSKTQWNTDDHWICGIDAERFIDAERPRVEVEVWVAN